MQHVRLALYDLKSGTAEEAAEVARAGLLPTLKKQPGYVRYEVAKLDSGGVVSFQIWETSEEALEAVKVVASWVAENLAERISLREEHVGDLLWDEA